MKADTDDPALGVHSWDERLRGDRNSFDAARLALATLVVLEHSFFLIDNSVHRDPLNILTGGQTHFGALAVWMFFSISGFLVTMSAVRSRSIADYLLRRVARIVPGFWMASVVGCLIVGPIAANSVTTYLADQNWIVLALRVLTLHQANPAGTLEANPVQLVHGTLWSIKYEFDCYLIIAALALFLTPRLAPYAYGAVAAILGLMIVFSDRLPKIDHGALTLLMSSPHEWPTIFPFFFVGSAFYIFRTSIDKSPFVAAACIVAIVISFAAGGTWWTLLFCGTYVCLFLALSTTSAIRVFGDRVDLSYGVYLYGWPVQQLVLHYLGTGIGPWPLFAISMPLTLPVAYLSWRFIEKPALKLVRSRRGGD